MPQVTLKKKKGRYTKIRDLPAQPSKKGKEKYPDWDEISEDFDNYVNEQISKNKKLRRKILTEKKGSRKKELTDLAFKFMKEKQKQNRLERTAWKKGGISLYSHGFVAAAKAGRFDANIIKAVNQKGTIKYSQIIELKKEGKLPRTFTAGKLYDSLKEGNITKESALKAANAAGYKSYIYPYKRGDRTISGHFARKIKPKEA